MTAMAMVVLVLVGASSMAQVLAQCGTTSELVACLPAAEADVQPSAECCTVLSGYLSTATPEACLCQAATSSAFESSGADVQFAVQIPQKCNLSYRAGTQCDGTRLLAIIPFNSRPQSASHLHAACPTLFANFMVVRSVGFSGLNNSCACRCYHSRRSMNHGAPPTSVAEYGS